MVALNRYYFNSLTLRTLKMTFRWGGEVKKLKNYPHLLPYPVNIHIVYKLEDTFSPSGSFT